MSSDPTKCCVVDGKLPVIFVSPPSSPFPSRPSVDSTPVNQALCAEFDPTEVPKDRNAARVGGNWKAGRQPEKN